MLLFQDNTPEAGYAGSGKETFGYEKYLAGFKNAVESALDIGYFQSFFTELEDQAVKTSRSIAANIEGYSDMMEKSMMNVYKRTVMIGGSTKDVVDFAEAFAAQTGKVPQIQEDVIVNAIRLSKEFGISTKETASMVGEFSRIGLGQERAISAIRDIGNTARRYGVNAQALTKTVQENLKKANAFTFKDGIKGLTDMAAKAQKLGMSMDSAFSVYEQFLDPDKAIEMGTEIGMLGGAFAKAFGDPMKNMNMSVEEVQENFIKAAQESAVFNAETGKFEIPKEQQKAILSFASKLNLDMKEFSSVALQGAKNTKILTETQWKSGITEEDKELVSSLAQLGDGGAFEVQLPGTKDWVKTSELTAEQIKDLKSKMEQPEIDLDSTKTKEENQKIFNEKFLSSAERQNNTLVQIRDALILKATPEQGSAATKALTTLSETASGAIKKITDTMPVGTVLSTYETINTNLKTYITSNDGLKETMANLINAINRGVNNITGGTSTEDAFFPSGGAPVVMSEDEIYKGIEGDQIIMGTNLDKGLDTIRQQQQTLASIVNTSLDIGTPSGNKPNLTLQNALSEKSTKLQEVVATTNSNINVSGGANVSGSVDVKVTGSGINLDDPKLSALITAKVSSLIEQRLSKEWAEKQGNIQTS